MKINVNLVIGIIYITILVTVAVTEVGETSEPATYDWGLPISVFLAFFAPFLLGYLAGKQDS